MDSDVLRPSRYASKNMNEDFAEAFELYFTVRGSEFEARYRELFPTRFAILDRLVEAYESKRSSTVNP